VTSLESAPLAGIRLLLLEDDALISLDTADMLSGLGAGNVLVAHSIEEAEAILARETVDAAVLDLVIGRRSSEDLARRLIERPLPIIFASGYGDAASLPQGLQAVPTVRKPYSPQALRDALAQALAGGGRALR
jgi:CheY-like chemotaxis protein